MCRIYRICTAIAVAACTACAGAQSALDSTAQLAQSQVETLSASLRTSLAAGEMKDAEAQALVLDALLAAWHETAEGSDFTAVQATVDEDLKQDAGTLAPRAVLECLLVTSAEKYREALARATTKLPSDTVYQMRAAAAWKKPLPEVPAVKAESSTAGARSLAEIVDSYEALPIPERTTSPTAENGVPHGPWKEAATRAASPWLHHGADKQDAVARLTAAYALAKGVRLGLLPKSDAQHAAALYQDAGTSSSAPAAIRLLAATEIAQLATATLGHGKTVLGDAWFNSQRRHGLDGKQELFHYKWGDPQNSGFSFFGSAFTGYGARLMQLDAAPTKSNLSGADVYVIASPDTPAKNPSPHFMDETSADAIEAWVRAGGVLLLMENDKNNSEFEHFDLLSERFGIHFQPVMRNTVEGRHFEQGKLEIPADTGTIFPQTRTVYMKEICTITVTEAAQAIYRDHGDVLMAVARVGKGTVWAVVDPWFYNEYTDGRKLPAEYENFPAAKDVARWALRQARK